MSPDAGIAGKLPASSPGDQGSLEMRTPSSATCCCADRLPRCIRGSTSATQPSSPSPSGSRTRSAVFWSRPTAAPPIVIGTAMSAQAVRARGSSGSSAPRTKREITRRPKARRTCTITAEVPASSGIGTGSAASWRSRVSPPSSSATTAGVKRTRWAAAPSIAMMSTHTGSSPMASRPSALLTAAASRRRW